ncbi:FG-GAP-like repeat-containing protein [Candidatus Nitrotoga sp. M5]|uniref:FG-GAP-like repeat-containing protein n=1 Tax=Candidatus Nitrotoga sp. M5 TaxID=2890409 RepID=UPI001EF610EE|nr:FG-GAP-like repeat-containing protein [Candidatus Nitrotoga sp. M5]CAH1387688.1 hypothetical protein NTGM5_690004 [Candidatus Nitrotoga sp. M5]
MRIRHPVWGILFFLFGVPFTAYSDGGHWWVSENGTEPWRLIGRSCMHESQLRGGDFNGDLKMDLFSVQSGQFMVSYSGGGKWSNWTLLRLAPNLGPKNIRFGDFTGDGVTDIFIVQNGGWYLSKSGKEKWKRINKSGYALEDLRFGDYDGDRITDVYSRSAGKWQVSISGRSKWKTINFSDSNMKPGWADPGKALLNIGDFVGNSKNDKFVADTIGCPDTASTKSVCGMDSCPSGYHPTQLIPQVNGKKSFCYHNNTSNTKVICKPNWGDSFKMCQGGPDPTECPPGYTNRNSNGIVDLSFHENCGHQDNNQIACWRSSATSSGSQGLTIAKTNVRKHPAVYSRGVDKLDVVGYGMDDKYYLSSWNGESWSNWSPIGVGEFESGPAIGSLHRRALGADQLSVIGLGKDDHYYQSDWNDQRWSAWKQIGNGLFTSAPSLLSSQDPYLFGIGKDRRVYFATLVNGRWSKWTPIGSGTFTSAPSAVSMDSSLYVFARGDESGMYFSSKAAGQQWSEWARIGNGTFDSAPAAVSWKNGQLDVFALGKDSKMWQARYHQNAWSGWFKMNGDVVNSAPSVVSTSATQADMVVVGKDGRIYHNVWSGDRWSGWLADTPTAIFQ